MEPTTLAMIALTLVATKATEKVGEIIGESSVISAKQLLDALRQKSPETLKRLEATKENGNIIDVEIVNEIQQVAETESEVQEALDATAQAMQQQFGGTINKGKLAEKIGFVFQGGYNPVKIEKFEL